MTDCCAGQTVETARRSLAARFRSGDIDSPELDARLLMGAMLGLDLTGIVTAAKRTLSPDQSSRLENFARRRLAGEPDLQFTDHADLKHGCRHSRLARRAENSPAPSLTCALTAR